MKLKDLTNGIKANSPTILTIVGLIGMAVTVGLAIQATPKAVKKIDETYDELPEEVKDEKDDFTLREKTKIAGKYYIPTLVTGAGAAACIIFSNRISTERLRHMTTLYSMSETAAIAWQQKALDAIGKKKTEKIEGEVAKDEMRENPSTERNTIEKRKDQEGSSKCYDRLSGRYFYARIEDIKDAVNKLNADLLDQDFVSLNDFYYFLKLPPIDIGNELGWNTNMGRRESLIELIYTPELDEYDEPVVAFTSRVRPRYDYTKLL